MGSIFYVISVAGNNTYSKNTKMGVGKRPDATSGDCEMIQLYEYIIVDKMACCIFRFYILFVQRCWWGCELYRRHIWRRNVMRRYVLVDVQSEDMFIDWKGFMVYIFYIYNVVGGVVNCLNLIYGGRTSLFLLSEVFPKHWTHLYTYP